MKPLQLILIQVENSLVQRQGHINKTTANILILHGCVNMGLQIVNCLTMVMLRVIKIHAGMRSISNS